MNADIVKLIPPGKTLIIEASDGQRIIANAFKVFKSGISPEFKKYGSNINCLPSRETLLVVYELTVDIKTCDVFPNIYHNLDKMVLTQEQIIRLCERFPEVLCQKGYATLFLTKELDYYFIVSVYAHSSGLYVDISPLSDQSSLKAKEHNRIICPKFNLAA